MDTMNNENDNNLEIATKYYSAMLQKNFDAMASYLHPQVFFIGPLVEMRGKEAIISAAKNLTHVLSTINIRSKFASGNQIMLAYDFIFPLPIGSLRAAVLMEFTNQLISRIELFHDSKPFRNDKP